jgi:hypothetical protein
MDQEEDASFTFSDEDFERRYCCGDASPAGGASDPATQSAKPLAVPIARSRNRYMRTLLRRRMAASART